MEPLLVQHRDDIVELCRRYRVRRLEVFGSAVTGTFDVAQSDVDLLVEFQPLAEGEYADTYFGLLAALESLLGRAVDLVMTHAIRNPYFLDAIGPTRTCLYAA